MVTDKENEILAEAFLRNPFFWTKSERQVIADDLGWDQVKVYKW